VREKSLTEIEKNDDFFRSPPFSCPTLAKGGKGGFEPYPATLWCKKGSDNDLIGKLRCRRRKEVTFIKNILILMSVNDLGSKNSCVSEVKRW
jgi:hypothetical protein